MRRPRILKPGGNELTQWAERLGVRESRFARCTTGRRIFSHPAMSVNLDACIQCTRCVRACREEQNNVIGYAGRGGYARIVFDFDDAMGASHVARRMRAGLPHRRVGPAKAAYQIKADKEGRASVHSAAWLPTDVPRERQQDHPRRGRDGPQPRIGYA